MAHEIEDNDHLFLVKIPAWHGIGVVLPESPEYNEALRMTGLERRVEGVPVYLKGGYEVDGYKAIKYEDDKEAIAVLTDSYEILQTSEHMAYLEQLIEEGLIELETGGTLKGGRKCWMMARVKGADAEVRRGDRVRGYLLAAHAHDGSMSACDGFVNQRVVCANTMAMALGESGLSRVRHTRNMRDRVSIAQESIVEAVKTFHESIKQAKRMTKVSVDAEEVVQYVADVFKPKTEDALERITGEVLHLFEEGEGNGQGSVWDLVNGVSDYLSHVRGRSQEGRLDSLFFGEASNINARAWTQALKLAA